VPGLRALVRAGKSTVRTPSARAAAKPLPQSGAPTKRIAEASGFHGFHAGWRRLCGFTPNLRHAPRAPNVKTTATPNRSVTAPMPVGMESPNAAAAAVALFEAARPRRRVPPGVS